MVEQLVKALSDCACSHFREREQNCYLGSGLYVKVFFNRLLYSATNLFPLILNT